MNRNYRYLKKVLFRVDFAIQVTVEKIFHYRRITAMEVLTAKTRNTKNHSHESLLVNYTETAKALTILNINKSVLIVRSLTIDERTRQRALYQNNFRGG